MMVLKKASAVPLHLRPKLQKEPLPSASGHIHNNGSEYQEKKRCRGLKERFRR